LSSISFQTKLLALPKEVIRISIQPFDACDTG
jgi:hypothetical protein